MDCSPRNYGSKLARRYGDGGPAVRPGCVYRTLPIPLVLRPVSTAGGTDTYRITQQVGRTRIVPGGSTTIWGYNGTFPGPTIISRPGRRTVVEHTNRLPLPTVVHLHGGRTPHLSDGYPTDYVYPTDMGMMANFTTMQPLQPPRNPAASA